MTKLSSNGQEVARVKREKDGSEISIRTNGKTLFKLKGGKWTVREFKREKTRVQLYNQVLKLEATPGHKVRRGAEFDKFFAKLEFDGAGRAVESSKRPPKIPMTVFGAVDLRAV